MSAYMLCFVIKWNLFLITILLSLLLLQEANITRNQFLQTWKNTFSFVFARFDFTKLLTLLKLNSFLLNSYISLVLVSATCIKFNLMIYRFFIHGINFNDRSKFPCYQVPTCFSQALGNKAITFIGRLILVLQ